jgi:hypothetical protein
MRRVSAHHNARAIKHYHCLPQYNMHCYIDKKPATDEKPNNAKNHSCGTHDEHASQHLCTKGCLALPRLPSSFLLVSLNKIVGVPSYLAE